jgi:hypothetical protein
MGAQDFFMEILLCYSPEAALGFWLRKSRSKTVIIRKEYP